MNKSTKIVKKLLALFLVVLMSIESFAAVVGDNDGAAFITKAEFESLKNDFQTQINRYNTSLDNKIDGAIASYLAGVRVAPQSTLVNLLKEAKEKADYNVGFVGWESPTVAKDVADVEAQLYWKWVNRTGRITDGERRDNELYGGLQLNNNSVWAGGGSFVRYHDYDKTISNYDSSYYIAEFPFGEKDYDNRKTTKNVTDWILNDRRRQRCHFYLLSLFDGWNDSSYEQMNASSWVGFPTPVMNDFTTAGSSFSIGPAVGTSPTYNICWFSQYIYPRLGISHTWSIYNDTGRANKKLDYLYSGTIDGTTPAIDFAFRDAYVTDNQLNLPIARTKPANTYNGDPAGMWIFMQYWYTNPDSGAKYMRGIRNDLTDAYDYDNRPEFRWKWNRQKIYTLNWTNLTHKYWNEKFSTQHYKYQGIPICRTPNKIGKLKFKLKFTNKVLTTGANVNPTSSANYYTYVITDKKFKNGNLPSKGSTDTYWRDTDGYDHVFLRAVRNSGTYQYTTDWIEIDKSKIIDKDNGDYIYIKVSPNNADQVVTVEVADLITYTEEG